MLETFRKALDITLKNEGGYVNDKDDPGGPTNYGVIQETYDDYNKAKKRPLKPVKYITIPEVEDIYDDYWYDAGCDKLAEFDSGLAIGHFDCAINCGSQTAIKILQRACRVKDDGIIGPFTIANAKIIHKSQLYSRLIHERNKYYARVCKAKPQMIKFLEGWLIRTYQLRITLGAYER
jgi:lysozyme family protein